MLTSLQCVRLGLAKANGGFALNIPAVSRTAPPYSAKLPDSGTQDFALQSSTNVGAPLLILRQVTGCASPSFPREVV
jgi:hypothetical protein